MASETSGTRGDDNHFFCRWRRPLVLLDTNKRVLYFVFKLGYQLYTIYEDTHMPKIEMLKASVPGIMEQEEYGHHFRIAHQSITMVLAFLLDFANSYSILFNSFVKNFAEIIAH